MLLECAGLLTPVSLPAGVVLAEQNHGAAIAGIGVAWIADADWLDRLDRMTRRMGRIAHSCRRIVNRQSASYSRTGRWRSLLFPSCSGKTHASSEGFIAFGITRIWA